MCSHDLYSRFSLDAVPWALIMTQIELSISRAKTFIILQREFWCVQKPKFVLSYKMEQTEVETR